MENPWVLERLFSREVQECVEGSQNYCGSCGYNHDGPVVTWTIGNWPWGMCIKCDKEFRKQLGSIVKNCLEVVESGE